MQILLRNKSNLCNENISHVFSKFGMRHVNFHKIYQRWLLWLHLVYINWYGVLLMMLEIIFVVA